MVETSEDRAITEARKQVLRKEWEKVIRKRQDHIIDINVALYRSNELTPERAYSVFASISELRSAKNEIG